MVYSLLFIVYSIYLTTNHQQTTPIMKEKQIQILNEALKLIPFDGWSEVVLRQAAINSGLDGNYAQIAFKNGVVDAIGLFHQKIDEATFAKIDNINLKEMKIRERIYTILNTRFQIMDEYKSTVRKTMQFMAMPQNICNGTKYLWEMADKAWYAAGDNSADFNYYTKRATLIAVYTSTLLFWLEDESASQSESSEFLKRRIENIMQFEKLKKKVAGFSFV